MVYFDEAFRTRWNPPQAKGKTVMYLPAEIMEIGEVSVAAKDKVSVITPLIHTPPAPPRLIISDP